MPCTQRQSGLPHRNPHPLSYRDWCSDDIAYWSQTFRTQHEALRSRRRSSNPAPSRAQLLIFGDEPAKQLDYWRPS
jgi:hypothetical protein